MSESKQSFFSKLGIGKSSGPNAGNFFSQGRSKIEQKHFSGALEDFNLVIELTPSNLFAYYFRGVRRAALGDVSGAIEDYDHAILNSPHCARVFYLSRGDAKCLLEDYEGAITDYTKSLELKNCPEVASVQNEEVYFRRGRTKLRLGQLKSGCSDLQKAAEAGCPEAAETLKQQCLGV